MTFKVELSGGPNDGQQITVDELLGRLEFTEERDTPLDVKGDLLAGKRVSVEDWEDPGSISHWYSRSEPARHRNGARVYRYVKHQPLEQDPS